jgi:hypothetical protein
MHKNHANKYRVHPLAYLNKEEMVNLDLGVLVGGAEAYVRRQNIVADCKSWVQNTHFS